MDRKIAKLKKKALGYRNKQKFSKAADAFEGLIELEPDNPNWPHKLGEVRRSLGQTARAVGAFEQAADVYAALGFALKAVAMCKMILSIDPDNDRIRSTLESLGSGSPEKQQPPTEPAVEPVTEARGDQDSTPPAPGLTVPPPLPPSSVASSPESQQDPPPEDDEEDEGMFEISLVGLEDDGEDSGVWEIALEPEEPSPAEPDSVEIVMDAEPPDPNAEQQDGALEEIELAGRLPTIPLLSSLSRDELLAFVHKAEVQQYEAGEIIIRQGEPGDALFILVEGKALVVKESKGNRKIPLLQRNEGSFFGEYALLTKLQRTATVEAKEDCTVLTISRSLMRELVDEHPPVLLALLRFFRERMVSNLTRTHRLFKPFNDKERRNLVDHFAWLEVPEGENIVEADSMPDGLYLLVCGRASVHRQDAPAGFLVTGEMFCKTALLEGTATTHTVTTESKCWVLRLPREKFYELIMTHPHMLATVSDAKATGSYNVRAGSFDDREETLVAV